jgi:DHA1 family multidrug resistance protein-like MFS transporter
LAPISPWKRNLYAAWLAQFATVGAFSVVVPTLPFYLRELGVQSDAAVGLWAGFLFAAPGITMVIFNPIWGWLSDRWGRKVMVERAMFGGALVIVLMGLSQNVQQLAVVRTVQGVFGGTYAATTALVAAAVPRERVGYALGMIQMAFYAGLSVGPPLGGLMCDFLGCRAGFLITGGLLLLPALAVRLLVQEEFTRDVAPARAGARGGWQPVRQRIAHGLAVALGSSTLFGVMSLELLTRLGSWLLGPVLPLFVESIAPSGARVASLAGLVSGVNAGGAALGALASGRLVDRMGSRAILLGCAATSAASYVLQFLVSDAVVLVLLQAVAGFALGGTLTSVSVALAAMVPNGREGLVFGVAASVTAVGKATVPVLGGALAVWLGLRAPFLATAIAFALTAVVAAKQLPGRRSAVNRGPGVP